MRPGAALFGWFGFLVLACRAAPTATTAPPPAPSADPLAACLDRALSDAGLNRFGDASGTVYAGGTPLFDEATGKSIDRTSYVESRRPDLVARCRAGTSPPK